MGLHVIKKGLDLPMAGAPRQTLEDAQPARRVALIADDYVGMRPTFFVKAGETVKRGQALFEDKKTPGVLFTAPGAGVVNINRGERRALQSVVIEMTPGADEEDAVFTQYTGKDLALLTRDETVALLVESGLWTALRARPFGRVPAPATKPQAIFINAMDSNPHAPEMDAVVAGREADLAAGVLAVSKLTDGTVYFCRAAGAKIAPPPNIGVEVEEFSGPHPSGTVGVHMHTLYPVNRSRVAWYLGIQDVLAFGALFQTGRLNVERVVSLAGPGVKQPRLLRTRLGASLDDLTANELDAGEQRVISGSVLSGRAAMGGVHGYLGRYHQQVCALREGRERFFLGWMAPGNDRFSLSNAFASALQRGKKTFGFTTALNGGHRAMVPIGLYERVMPMDIMPTFLLRALIMDDIERAEKLGCLELEEEDLALCTFVCPCKFDYGPILRRNLSIIEKEG